MIYNFEGVFTEQICDLVEQKHALGYVYRESERILYTFQLFCKEHFPNENQLSQEMALKWAEQRDSEKNLFKLNRISVIRELAKYMNSIGVPAYLIPLGLTKKTARHIPHIYTMEELTALFQAADQYTTSSKAPARSLVVAVIFRMIYCCGLRPGETRKLLVSNVNLETGAIRILESKGHKDRLVMLSEDMVSLCRKYHKRVEKIYPDRKFFFPSSGNRKDGMYSMEWIMPVFRTIIRQANLNHCSGNMPRIYDLRYTFATHRLYQWLREGEDINTYLTYLSEYMGHGNLSETAYYIHLVPEFFPLMSQINLEGYDALIPEVE